jgi:hypothetical protein
MEKITAVFTKILCIVSSKFTHIDGSPESILYVYIYCMGQDKKTLKIN